MICTLYLELKCTTRNAILMEPCKVVICFWNLSFINILFNLIYMSCKFKNLLTGKICLQNDSRKIIHKFCTSYIYQFFDLQIMLKDFWWEAGWNQRLFVCLQENQLYCSLEVTLCTVRAFYPVTFLSFFWCQGPKIKSNLRQAVCDADNKQ